MTNKELLANSINGREYGHEITPEEEALAKANGLLVIFGASDDLCEFRGAVSDEPDFSKEGSILIGRDGKPLPQLDNDDKEVLRKYGVLEAVTAKRKSAIKIDCLWCEEDGYSWTYRTDAAHACFEILEDGKKYCRGIVLDLNELW